MALEILEREDEGFAPAVSFNGWKVAFINSCDMLLKENRKKMERHLETDEVFMLLSGEASLWIGEERREHKMEQNKLYRVHKGTWHGITLLPNSKVVVVENDDTTMENTEHKFVDKF